MVTLHECPYPGCGKRFDRKYNLKCHRRIHSDEKPYLCSHARCKRAFRWKSSLNHHLMSLDHASPADRLARKAATRITRPRRPLTRRSKNESRIYTPSIVEADDPVIAHHLSELQALSTPSLSQTSSSLENSVQLNHYSHFPRGVEYTQIPPFSFGGTITHFDRDSATSSMLSNSSLNEEISVSSNDLNKIPAKNEVAMFSSDELQYSTQTNTMDLILSDALNESATEHALPIY